VGEKRCFKCGEVKPLTDFYKHPKMADGHVNKCKPCNKSDVWHHRKENIERIRAYDRDRAKNPDRIARTQQNTAEYLEKYPDRYAANIALGNALRSGKIKKMPCFMCGELKVEAHHPDYSAPLAVSWLCAAHHKELHLAYPEDHYTKTS
jgi:hypothetical protein